jgi:hypothetical protein
LRHIELPSEALAKELQRYLQERRLEAGERNSASIRFSSEMKEPQWIRIKGTVEKWARGRQMNINETMKLLETESPSAESDQEIKKRSQSEKELKARIDALTPEMARERYNYLQSKPIGELTDDEYDERLELAQRDFKKTRK